LDIKLRVTQISPIQQLFCYNLKLYVSSWKRNKINTCWYRGRLKETAWRIFTRACLWWPQTTLWNTYHASLSRKRLAQTWAYEM